ncbi:MAG: aminotransferase class V-fold PLP-dependent enzyme [Rhodothermales bacterium]|nr:aminotransferase class V-fold PLP-dependent enzyme [Rhodothermales bacterium]
MTLDALRRQFPHTEETVYLNHAAVAPLSRRVVAALAAYTEERHRTHIENFAAFQPVIDETKARLARLVGAAPARIAFAPNTSYALNVLALGLDWQPGDRIAVPGCEFPANVYPWMHLQQRGVAVDFVPHREGTFTVDDVARVLTPRTRVLAVSWVQFLSGFRADLEGLGRLCRERGVLFCVDAIQGLGALRLDAAALGIDFLACGGHKWLMGVQGIGFLYLSEALQQRVDPPMAGWLHGPVDWDDFFSYRLAFHDDAERFRLGTLNHLGVAALHAALGLYQEAGATWCEARVLENARALAAGLDRLGLARYGSADPDHASGIVSVRHPAPEAVYEALKARGIVASLRNRLLRFAPTYYNSPDEIDRTVAAVREAGQEVEAAP